MKRLHFFAFALGLVVLAGTAAADNYPSRPIRLIVPYPAGGSTDIMARALQEPMANPRPAARHRQPRGRGRHDRRQRAARADPDGYTLLFANNGPISIAPLLQKGVDFDPLKSFAPVSLVSKAPLVLVVSEKVPVNDAAGLIAYAKAQGKPMLYATAGPGSLGHLSTERFLNQAGLQMIHVPYRGQAPTTLAIFAGEVDILLTTTSDTLNEYIRSGKVKLLGVSSPEPSAIARAPRHRKCVEGVFRRNLVRAVGSSGHAARDRRQTQRCHQHNAVDAAIARPLSGLRCGGRDQYSRRTVRHHSGRNSFVAQSNRRASRQGRVTANRRPLTTVRGLDPVCPRHRIKRVPTGVAAVVARHRNKVDRRDCFAG